MRRAITLLCATSAAAYVRTLHTQRARPSAAKRRPQQLRAKTKDDDPAIGKQAKGFYIRPSAAIEKGRGLCGDSALDENAF